MEINTDLKMNTTPLRLMPAGLAIVAVTYGFARYAYGLFLPEIQHDLGLSIEVMGFISSGSCLGYLVATAVGSTISGNVGPRLPVALGGLCAVVGMLIMAGSSNLWMLAVGMMLAGASSGLAYPPLSDTVMRIIEEPFQNRTYAVINSGTSVGVIISGPVALLAGDEWRQAWIAFAVIAVFVTLWNFVLLPTGPYQTNNKVEMPQIRWGWLIGAKSIRLFIAATLFGISTSVYWTFAVDLLVYEGGLSESWSRLFWVVIGSVGILGGLAGDFAARFGLIRVFFGAVISIAFSMALIAVAPGLIVATMISAFAFGGAFIMISGLLGIWSVNIFIDRPSAGFGATFFLIAAGQLIGVALAGLVAGILSLKSVFLLASVVALSIVLFSPSRNIHSMARQLD